MSWLPEAVSDAVGAVGLLVVVLFFFGSVVSVLRRLPGSVDDDRLRLLWFLFGSLSVPVALLMNWASYFLLDDPTPVAPVAGALVMCALPVAIGVAIVRTRLFDIELVLSRTLTYGALTALVFGGYAGLLALAESLFDNSTVGGIGAIAVVAVAAAPTQRWLRDRIERWIYGYRSEPHRAIRMMSDRVDAADPAQLLMAITGHGHRGAPRAPRLDRARRRRNVRPPVWCARRSCTGDSGSDPSLSRSRPDARSPQPTPRSWTTWPARPRYWCAPRSSTPICRPHARDSSPHAKKSASDYVATCTTASGPPWPPWCSS